ncbi:hypothetical protein [Halorientalis salina]|uniref:hypothetical protein n=1 Tax=Halorientalis salina TaxID=2932266 RepID=UPI0010AD010B|nr:hypothetical protein [Halorientalis salina]
MRRTIPRRVVLSGIAAGAAGLAGCSSDSTGTTADPDEESTPDSDRPAEEQPEEETPTDRGTPAPVEATVVDTTDPPEDRDIEPSVTFEITNNTDERLLAARMEYKESAVVTGTFFDLAPNETRTHEVDYPYPDPNDPVTVPDQWTWFPGDDLSRFEDDAPAVERPVSTDDGWYHAVENRSDMALDDVEEVQAIGTHDFRNDLELDGAVSDGQLLIDTVEYPPAPWEYSWEVELTGVTGTERFPVSVPPLEPSIEDVTVETTELEEGDRQYGLQSVDVDIAGATGGPVFNAEVRLYQTGDSLQTYDGGEEPDFNPIGWEDTTAPRAPSFLGLAELTVGDEHDGADTIFDAGDTVDRSDMTRTVSFQRENRNVRGIVLSHHSFEPMGDRGADEKMGLDGFELPLDEDERVGAMLVCGNCVLDYETSASFASQIK